MTLQTQAIQTLDQVRAFVAGTEPVSFTRADRPSARAWMADTLKRFGYAHASRADRGVLRLYLAKATGLSRAQITRRIAQFLALGRCDDRRGSPAAPFAAGIIPEGMLIEFQEAAKGQHDPFMAMIDWCERSVSKAILGQNVGHDSASKGSLAGSEVDNEVRKDLLKSDARQLQGTLTRDLIYPILAINKGLGDIRRCPRRVFDFRDDEDLGVFAESLPKLVGIGMKIPANWAHEKLSIPEPIEGEDVLTAGNSAPPVVPPAAETAPVAPVKAALKFTPLADVTPSDTNQLADVVESAAAPALQDMLEQTRTLAEKSDSLEQLRDWLLDAYGELDSSKMAQVMATGLGIANLTGRYDVAASHGMLPNGADA